MYRFCYGLRTLFKISRDTVYSCHACMLKHLHTKVFPVKTHLTTGSFLFYSLDIFSLRQDLFLVCLRSICALLTSGLSLILFTILLLLTADLVDNQNIYIFAFTETSISPNTTSAKLFDASPRGFTFINTPCPVPDSFTSSIVGGDT